MNRSPLFYPLNRGTDADAGGAADLQTDVMRFMAILSLCLVAIFAVMQSIPLTPTTPPPTLTELRESQQPPVENKTDAPIESRLARPSPVKPPVKAERLVVQRPRATLIPLSQPKAMQQAAAAESQPVEKGFTLRFETDLALTRLVEQNSVGLYVITTGESVRMNIDNNEISFWPASTPRQFHEMDVLTVPERVTAAYRRSYSYRPADRKWGVTLPNGMSRQLHQYLAEYEGGALIISAAGDLRLEQ